MTILKWLTPALMALSSYAQPPYDSGFAAELKYGPSFPWPTVPNPTAPDVRNEEVLALVNEVFKDAGVGQTYQSVEGYRFIQLSKKKMYLVAAVTIHGSSTPWLSPVQAIAASRIRFPRGMVSAAVDPISTATSWMLTVTVQWRS